MNIKATCILLVLPIFCEACPPSRYSSLSSDSSGKMLKDGEVSADASSRDISVITLPSSPPNASACGLNAIIVNNKENPGIRVIGGSDVTYGKHPWMVRLYIGKRFLCGGTLIHKDWVITAAHCFVHTVNPIDVIGYVGDHDRTGEDSNEQTVSFSEIIIHPEYEKLTRFDYDAALLRLSDSLDLGKSWFVQKICLPTSDADGCEHGHLAEIVGWGITNTSEPYGAKYLQEAKVPIQPLSDCVDQYGSRLTDNMICAGYPDGAFDTCKGDSGGPMVTSDEDSYRLCGITSWGRGCALKKSFGVYTRIVAIAGWIQHYLNDSLDRKK